MGVKGYQVCRDTFQGILVWNAVIASSTSLQLIQSVDAVNLRLTR